MKHMSKNLVFLATLTSVACQSAGDPPSPEPLPAETEWVTLFDGMDLSHFNLVGEAEWNIIDDYVEADGYLSSYLLTKDSYSDFHLKVEFWPSPDANSGVYIRCQDPDEITPETGYEINIYDQNTNPEYRTGAIVRFTPPLASIEAGGQWNTYEITADGSHIVARLNGTLVADLEDESYSSGPIALQNNGGLIRFRNVQIKPL